MSNLWPGLIEAYRSFLPVSDSTPVITLQEGNTPLIHSRVLSERVGNGARVYLKYEGLNPTGSFKDRGMTMAISKALETGTRAVMCASTGNTSASAAAYAARAGITAIVIIPKGAIALGKLAQALIHGAKLIAIDGNFDDALNVVRRITDTSPVALVNSLNPYRIEGQKTGAFEICDQLGAAPDYHCIPVGNAGNITAYWKGYNEYHCMRHTHLPIMLGFQAAGSAPIVLGKKVDDPETIATAIRIGNPASWQQAEAARDESGGSIDKVTDEEILTAYQMLARSEGVFVEPASAASVAGLLHYAAQGYFTRKDATIVCVVTGHGLKDPDRAVSCVSEPAPIPATYEAVMEQIGDTIT